MKLQIAALWLICAGPVWADAPIFVLDQTQLPFDLGPGAPANSPARQGNSPSAAANSSASGANSSSAYANSPRNPENAKRVLFTREGDVVGYYAENGSGTLNLFTLGGKRALYRPKGTKSLFSSTGDWCGTVAAAEAGGFAFGVTRKCASLLLN
ncbi:hypothetical protein [Paracoccus aminophilus]|uniref:Secreted protein n=1 Tax=Paracoccus aminophilus JCM 7686 TaxID=1367847 RepID=S5Y127_PARAH|nr:hypothetical protein [Paracoccus aminophilus]AGT09415.1 hypothetical protein JCM7686_2345 [Paracoccus aminophilus JCM 7686]